MKECICKTKSEREKAFHDFMDDQLHAILRDKWIDSEIAGRDLTNEGYVQNWIMRNARKFREIWESEHGEKL